MNKTRERGGVAQETEAAAIFNILQEKDKGNVTWERRKD